MRFNLEAEADDLAGFCSVQCVYVSDRWDQPCHGEAVTAVTLTGPGSR